MSKPIQQGVTSFKNDAEIIACETLYRGFFSLDLYHFCYRLSSSGMNGEVTREIFERGHAAVLLPSDPVRDEVVLVGQIRITAYDTNESPWLLEMVASMIEAGETVEDVVRREALEETGLEVGWTKPILSYLVNPDDTSERLSILVRGVGASTAKSIRGLVGEDEGIRMHVANQEQACQRVEEGKIDSAASVITLQWLQLHYHSLRNEWTK